MSEKIRFEIQIRDDKATHGWRALSRDGWFYTSKDNRVETLTLTVEKARASLKRVKGYFKRNYLVGEFRIVKVTTVKTYDVVE